MAWAVRGAVIAAGFGIAAASNAVSLTGICGFVTDAGGNWQIGWYNTHGPDGGKNAYVVRDDVNGGFLNSGNGAATQVSIDLSAPGDYTLFSYFDGNEIYGGRDFWGLNLFFDGDQEAPGISAFGAPQGSGDNNPEFWANSGNTLNLAADEDRWGSGSLSYRSGNTEVILTRYATTSDVYSLDRVDNFQLGSSGRNDHVTVIGLTVVPEPASLSALVLGSLALLRRRRKS
jgi:hypothetical protein